MENGQVIFRYLKCSEHHAIRRSHRVRNPAAIVTLKLFANRNVIIDWTPVYKYTECQGAWPEPPIQEVTVQQLVP